MINTKILEMSNVSLGYKDKIVIPNFSWELFRGDRYIISGPNGCGKTTLIRTILGLIKPQGGRISLFDESGLSLDKVNMSYLPQINQIDRAFPIKVKEVVDSALPYRGISKSDRRDKIDFLLHKVELSDWRDKSISNLSGGQLQRLLLARSLAPNPEILVLDEPMSFLDEDYKSKLNLLLEDLLSPSAVVLMVTHERFEAFGHWKSLCMRL